MTHPTAKTIPKTGLPGLMENWRSDLRSGFLVFLIALPLCLGIAMASGFPPMSGIITAVIGGVLISRINGSYVTINGPAAGLIVVILSAAQSLGQGDATAGYRFTLAAIVVASGFQIILGLLKAGRLNAYFPASVVHGMLAAIGIIIMAKQIHVMLGVKPSSKEILDTIIEIPHSLTNLDPQVATTGFSGLIILALWSQIKQGPLMKIPGPLVVVATGMALQHYFSLDNRFLVNVPESVLSSFNTPDFGMAGTSAFWGSVISICLVGSLETLLSATAVDKLDPYKRYTDLNRDLTAVGAGNLLAGAMGGLPMIAEIVRSSANVTNGAKTGWANFFHGLFLALFVLLLPHLIDLIPLASLASLLVYTGFRLASPLEFAKTMDIGKEQLALFVITIVGVVTTDLLVGVLIGILAKILLHLAAGVNPSNLLKISYVVTPVSADRIQVKVQGAAIFSNFIGLKSQLSELPEGCTIHFDFTDASFIDHTFMEFINHFRHDHIARGGKCELRGLGHHKPYSRHPLATRRI